MPGKLLIFLASLVFLACAHPNYADENSALGEMQNGACSFSFSSSVNCAQLTWEKMQTEDETGSFILNFGNLNKDKNLDLQDPPTLPMVRLWMPGMGHGSSPLTVRKLGTGVYHVSGVWFSMPGAWEIQVQFQDGQGASFESHLPVRY